jgi:hypothetical protein
MPEYPESPKRVAFVHGDLGIFHKYKAPLARRIMCMVLPPCRHASVECTGRKPEAYGPLSSPSSWVRPSHALSGLCTISNDVEGRHCIGFVVSFWTFSMLRKDTFLRVSCHRMCRQEARLQFPYRCCMIVERRNCVPRESWCPGTEISHAKIWGNASFMRGYHTLSKTERRSRKPSLGRHYQPSSIDSSLLIPYLKECLDTSIIEQWFTARSLTTM